MLSHFGESKGRGGPIPPPRQTLLYQRSKLHADYRENTYSTSAWRISRSSGVFTRRPLAPGLGPETIATYCLPSTSKVIGGAEKPEATLILHNSSRVLSSKAATVPSSSAMNTRPPPVARLPL